MPLTLTDQDLADLSRLMEDMRGKEMMRLSSFINERLQAQRLSEAKALAETLPVHAATQPTPHPLANGHAVQPPASVPTG